MYIFLSSSRAGVRYWRGSKSPGFSARWRRIAAVIARRPSESMLILQTADFAALRSCSSGIPTESGIFPPYCSIIFTYSTGTDEEPWRTIGNPGSFFSMASRTSNASGGGIRTPSGVRLHCAGVNLQRPCEVPMEIARESQPVLEVKSITSSGFVYLLSSAATSSSTPPRTPSSASTVTSYLWAYSKTYYVRATLSS